MAGPLSAVMIMAGAGMLPGAGAVAGLGASLGVGAGLTTALGSFSALPITAQFSNIVASATAVLGGDTQNSLRTLGAGTFPALTNAIPGGFSGALGVIAPGGVASGGFTGLISSTASAIMGNGDLGKFAQMFNSARGFTGQANQFINSGLNLSGISSTFGSATGGMDNLITGSFSQVSEAFGPLGADLSDLGNLIDMNNLPNLGNPSALIGQLSSVGGLVPGVESALRTAGVDSSTIASLAAGGYINISDSANKLLYDGMTRITGADLDQVKSVLGVRTTGITNMADLLNPTKILPTSFASLTMLTPDGLRGIYATAGGAVNTNLEQFFLDPAAPVYTGNDAVMRARKGLPPVEATV